MDIRSVPVIAFAVALGACTTSPEGFDGEYASHSNNYGQAMRDAVHAYERGEISRTEMEKRLGAAANDLAVSDAATAQSEQRELSIYSRPPPNSVPVTNSEASPSTPAAKDTGNDCLLIPCPSSPPPTNAGP